jgi:type II secretory pathway pseudopilin PulG
LKLRSSADAGETLLEVVISIAIMGIAFVALLGGMLTAASMSGRHRLQSDGHLQLLSAIEQVKAAPYAGNCVGADPLYPITPGAGWTITETVEFWDGTSFGPTCYETLVVYYTMQRITFVVASTDGRVNRTETILKRG